MKYKSYVRLLPKNGSLTAAALNKLTLFAKYILITSEESGLHQSVTDCNDAFFFYIKTVFWIIKIMFQKYYIYNSL